MTDTTAHDLPEDQFFEAPDFTLASGRKLPARLAYITLGKLNADRSNAVLLTHGFSTSHRYILPGDEAAETSWCGLVGPGRAIDTDRWFVVSSNALGSSYGSTGPGSTAPATGRPWGIDFPATTFADVVALQRRMLDSLGIGRLHAVAGVSMGGYQALQWGVQYPQDMDRLVVALSSFSRVEGGADLREVFARDPAWNGGHPAPGAMAPLLTEMRKSTLQRYGMDEWMVDQGMPEEARAREYQRLAENWAKVFHPVALLTLRRTIDQFDVRGQLDRIRAKLLLVLADTDVVFPSSTGPSMLAQLSAAGVDATYVELRSRYGHLASGLDWRKWAPQLDAFLRDS